MLRPLAAALWPGLVPEALPAVPGPGDLARLAAEGRPVLLLQPRTEGPWEGMLLARREAAAAPAPDVAVVGMPEMPAPSCDPGEGEVACDGVRFADLPHGGGIWHAGSVVPAWRQELLALGARPDAAALEAGEKKDDAPAEDIVDVDPEDLGEAPKGTAAPRKDDVTDADVVAEEGKPKA